MNSKNKLSHPIRRELAEHAAKMIAVEGITDYFTAKKKAAQKMGIVQTKFYPSNKEIEQALVNYQQLFLAKEHVEIVDELRSIALNALKLFKSFDPFLVGPVLSGTAHSESEIILHIFNESPQLVSLILLENNIPFEECERRARFKGYDSNFYPAFQFYADDHKIIVIVFPERQKYNPPLDPIDGHTIKRADYKDLLELLDYQY